MVKEELRLQVHSAGFFYPRMCFAEVGRLRVPRRTSVTLKYKAFGRSHVY